MNKAVYDFISMLYLHSDNKIRQLAIFARSMVLLNEVLNTNHYNIETYKSKQSMTDIDCSVVRLELFYE